MIAVSSHPPDFAFRDRAVERQEYVPYYVGVFGEAEPALDITHADAFPSGEFAAPTTAATLAYEY